MNQRPQAEDSLAEPENQVIRAEELSFCSAHVAHRFYEVIQEFQKRANTFRRSLVAHP